MGSILILKKKLSAGVSMIFARKLPGEEGGIEFTGKPSPGFCHKEEIMKTSGHPIEFSFREPAGDL